VLKSITLLRDRVEDWNVYPFNVPAIHTLSSLDLRSRICFFAGENGSGKSTLLEAIAANYGFGREGGNRNFVAVNTTRGNRSIEPLKNCMRLSFGKRTGQGFFLRAESLFNTATYVDLIGASEFYGGMSLHARSHGESFLTVLEQKCQRDGLYLLDEPEAALSPQRQLAFLVLMHDTVRRQKDAQFIISRHSPLLLGCPGTLILSFDEDHIRQTDYEDLKSVQIARLFLHHREHFLQQLVHQPNRLFPDKE
jgi:predicted ATPase